MFSWIWYLFSHLPTILFITNSHLHTLSLPITGRDAVILFLASSLHPESAGEYEAIFSCGFLFYCELSVRGLQRASRSERSSSLCSCQSLPICRTSSCSCTWTWRCRDWSPAVFCKLTSLAKWTHAAPDVCNEHQQQENHKYKNCLTPFDIRYSDMFKWCCKCELPSIQTDLIMHFCSFFSVPWTVSVVRGALSAYASLKCLIKQEVMHRTAMWEKLLKSPLSMQKPARPDQIKWFDTFSANRIRLINSQKCLND